MSIACYDLTAAFDYQESLTLYSKICASKNTKIQIGCLSVNAWPVAKSAFLADLVRKLKHKGKDVSLENTPKPVLRTVKFLLEERPEPNSQLEEFEDKVFDKTLGHSARSVDQIIGLFKLLEDIIYWTIIGPLKRNGYRYGRTLYEITERGLHSLPIVALVSIIMGLILAMQAGAQLKSFGANLLVANLVGISIVRELGPLLSAMLVTGRCGSAITAEIGSMVASEEIDALRAMGISITKYVVVPKFVALIIVMPCLTVFADLLGVFGGYAFCVMQYNIPSAEYINQTIQAVGMQDLTIGIVKSAADAIIIATIAVHQGLTTKGGAEGIGKSTTRSVVLAIIVIAIAHLFFTALFYYTGHTASFTK